MTYSKDFRQLVLSKLESKSYRELEKEFSISKTSILNWKKAIETQESINNGVRKHKRKKGHTKITCDKKKNS